MSSNIEEALAAERDEALREVEELEAKLKRKRKKIRNLKSLIEDLAYSDECDLDHHGSCQAHNWFGEGECPHARAQKILKKS